MLIRNSYTEAIRASASNSTDKIELVDSSGKGYEGLIVTSTLTGVVTAYMVTASEIVDNAALPYTTGLVLPASTAAGTYNIRIGAVKCGTAADAQKIIAFR